ncbi:MAG: hypothetical protein WBM04_17970 [Candidatus Korobacteraceae bacterium]
MKSRKQVWIAALCLLLATVITLGFRARLASVQAASAPVHASRAMSTQPVAHLANASLRAAEVRSAMMLDDDASSMRVAAHQQSNRPVLPQVEEFTLTPPNSAQGIYKSFLSVRFPELAAEKLASQIPITLGSQNVVLQRSADDPSLFSTWLDFNWQTFAEEQEQRKQAANQGRMVPVFQGRRLLRTERMQFVDPAQIEGALQSHQPIQFSGDVLLGSPVTVFPDHELMMVDTPIVEDNIASSAGSPARTFDQCLALANPPQPPGNQTGAWTFATLMMAMANATPTNIQPAENMLLGMLNSWNQDQHINGFTVFARPKMGSLGTSNLLSNWPVDPNPNNVCTGLNGPQACPSLLLAPVRLDAIVNRMDLGQFSPPFPPAGELRFTFTVTAGAQTSQQPAPCSGAGIFNIILEYNVPSSIDALTWAKQWNSLPDLNSNRTFSARYLAALQAITDQVVTAGACAGSSCISQVRSNEIELAPNSGINAQLWEQREFHFSNAGGTPVLSEGTIAMTPDPRFNTAGQPICSSINGTPGPCTPGTLSNYGNNPSNNQEIQLTMGALPIVPLNWPPPATTPFLGGSALNNARSFWLDTPPIRPETVRIDFSVNTCNACHGAETATVFQQVVNRPINHPSNLADFLLGCANGDDSCTPTSAPPNNQCPLSTQNLACTESVPDPNQGAGGPTSFGDIARRVTYLQSVCVNSTCNPTSGSQLLFPFMRQPIGVH